MERLTTPIRDSRQGPGTPPPAGSEATEDGGQRYSDDMSASEMSDRYPAGGRLYAPEHEPDTHSNAGRVRVEGGTDDQALTLERPHDSRVSTGRGDAEAAGPADAPRRNRRAKLDVRLSEEDREAVLRRARVLGVRPSSWARAVMLDALDARSSNIEKIERAALTSGAVPTIAPELGRAVTELRRVGSNLNQCMRAINSGKTTVLDADLLIAVRDAVDQVRTALGDQTAS